MLLEKMTDIIVHPKPLYEEKIGTTRFRGSSAVHKNTLNAGMRKRELERITKENY